MNLLLDTDTCIAVMKGQFRVIERLKAIPQESLAISTVTAFELYTGAMKCSRPTEEHEKIQRLFSVLHVMDFDERSAIAAATIRANLESGGQMIGPYDTLIAGQALAYSLILISNNLREFSRINDLIVESWTG